MKTVILSAVLLGTASTATALSQDEVNEGCNTLGEAALTGALARQEGLTLRTTLRKYRATAFEQGKEPHEMVQRFIKAGYQSQLPPQAAKRSYTTAFIEEYSQYTEEYR